MNKVFPVSRRCCDRSNAGFGFLFGVIISITGVERAIAQPEQPMAVDPKVLEGRDDLVGKRITVDDRVKYYQTPSGKDYVELYLKRTPVVFRLPARLRPQKPTPVVVQGTLIREGAEKVFLVESLTSYASDLERLEKGISALPPKDVEGRKAWAHWAEARGKEFNDRGLARRAETLLADALKLQSEGKRSTVDAPAEWLALAEEARRKHVPEPAPSALAHRAFRARLAAAARSVSTGEIQEAIERFFPAASKDLEAARQSTGRWEEAYSNDPAGAYRTATAGDRRAMDRRLWADALQQRLAQQAAENPGSAMALAELSQNQLPERPRLSNELLQSGLTQARANLPNLRLDEVKVLGQAYRERLQNPRAELELYRDWLKTRRERLSATDADGPVALAALYEELLQDEGTALELLRRAWKLAPTSNEVAEAFRSRGYRKDKEDWVKATPGLQAEARSETRQETGGSGRGLLGATAEEVLASMGGKPERKTYCGTRGQVIEQWIYPPPDGRRIRYVNFLHTPGDPRPRVVADYFLSKSQVKLPPAAPAR